MDLGFCAKRYGKWRKRKRRKKERRDERGIILYALGPDDYSHILEINFGKNYKKVPPVVAYYIKLPEI